MANLKSPEPKIQESHKIEADLARQALPLDAEQPSSKGVASDLEVASNIETAIMMEVSAALMIEPPNRLTIIAIEYQDGIVTLKGRVGSDATSKMAEETARQYPGVTATINALEVNHLLEG
jgi:osmotically-inducible protein OsmY